LPIGDSNRVSYIGGKGFGRNLRPVFNYWKDLSAGERPIREITRNEYRVQSALNHERNPLVPPYCSGGKMKLKVGEGGKEKERTTQTSERSAGGIFFLAGRRKGSFRKREFHWGGKRIGGIPRKLDGNQGEETRDVTGALLEEGGLS